MNTPMQSSQAPITPARGSAAFEFVRGLARELSGEHIELPSYPEVALRIQRLLSDPDADTAQLVRMLGAEPVLAARVLKLANSAAMNTTGRPVSELRTAIMRMGFDALRTTVIGFAVTQLRQAEEYRGIEAQLSALWQQNVWMATLSFVLARRGGRFNPDTAMLAGLVGGVGRLYILTRASAHADLFADQAAYQAIVRDWHANIARALLEHWQMADEVVQAVHAADHMATDERSSPVLADVLGCATLLLDYRGEPDLLAAQLQASRSARRLGLDVAGAEALLHESAGEIAALHDALAH